MKNLTGSCISTSELDTCVCRSMMPGHHELAGEILHGRAGRRFQLGRRANPRDAAVGRNQCGVRNCRTAAAVDQREIVQDEHVGCGRDAGAGRAPAVPLRRSAAAPMRERDDERLGETLHFVRSRASSSSRVARDGLNTPHEQNRLSTTEACSGVRRPSFTQSIIFFASDWLTMPCPHIVDSASTSPLGRCSVLPSNPSE